MLVKNILLIGLGGFAGSIARYLAYIITSSYVVSKSPFPWGTFWVNIVGCFMIGIFWALWQKIGWFDQELRMLLMIGFCGGFTTFSSYALDIINVSRENIISCLSYTISSVLLGLLAVVLGNYIVRWII